MSEYPSRGYQYGGEEEQSQPSTYGDGSFAGYQQSTYQQLAYGEGQATYDPAYAPQSYPPAPVYGNEQDGNVYSPAQQIVAQPDHQDDAEKGLAGALAGSVLGAYGGHKVNHGFIGAVGGAWAGSKLEDEYKASQQRPEKEKHHHHFFHRRSSSSSSSPQQAHKPVAQLLNQHAAQSGHAGQYGNFSQTARDISLNPQTLVLEARCAKVNGEYQTSQIDLNSILGRANGQFRWIFGGPPGDLAWSAQDVRAQYEDAKGTWPAGWYLRGQLRDNEGMLMAAEALLLDKNIENMDGHLTFCKYDTTLGL